MNRKKLSGSQYKKKATEKAEKLSNVLKQTQKVDTFFKQKKENEVQQVLISNLSQPKMNDSNSFTSPKKILLENQNVECIPSTSSAIHCRSLSTPQDQMCTGFESLSTSYSNDPSKWIINDELRDYFAVNGFEQNKNIDFSKSQRIYSNGEKRLLTKNMFERKHFNGQIIDRPWLIYSEISGKVFCGPCRLFQDNNNDSFLASEGYNDWKSASVRLKEHENSSFHKTCVVKLMDRGNTIQRIDSKLIEQVNKEKNYWRNVLTRIVAIVKKLASRGLPFRGHDEKIGSVNNGNFLMIVELLSEFDPFLSQHVTRFQNSGSGNTSYLSSTIYEEIIKLMANKVKNAIVTQIKTSKYYSIIVDSTPDISHVDQLSFIIRFVNENGKAMERFLGFIDNAGHKSEKLTSIVTDMLESLEINLADCRGQSYDNANNMSGPYKGLQARIRELNPLAFYIPCAAHSLNLVGTHSVEASNESVKFFCLLQHVYNFFSASTHRWSILNSHLKSNAKTVKSLSVTRWSSRYDACVSLNESWDEIVQVLKTIEIDKTEKSETICEARGLRIQLETLEMAFLAFLWGFLLHRLNAVSKQLQNINIDVCTVLELYDSLIHLVNSQRDSFNVYEEKALCKVKNKTYFKNVIKRKKTVHHDETRDAQVDISAKDNFRINTFYVILDRLATELSYRQKAYETFCKPFDFFTKLRELEDSEIVEKANELFNVYNSDLEKNELINELLHFRSHLIITLNEKKTTPFILMLIIYERDMKDLYPNIEIALRIFISTPATNCTAERSFSVLKRLKNYLRSNMLQERLNSLAMLTIESDITESLTYEDIINDFSIIKSRKKNL